MGLGRQGEKLEKIHNGFVCRHDLAEACRLALEHPSLLFDVLLGTMGGLARKREGGAGQ